MADVEIKRISTASLSNLGNLQLGLETTLDAQTGVKMWGAKDDTGNITRFIGKGQTAPLSNAILSSLSGTGDRYVGVDSNGQFKIVSTPQAIPQELFICKDQTELAAALSSTVTTKKLILLTADITLNAGTYNVHTGEIQIFGYRISFTPNIVLNTTGSVIFEIYSRLGVSATGSISNTGGSLIINCRNFLVSGSNVLTITDFVLFYETNSSTGTFATSGTGLVSQIYWDNTNKANVRSATADTLKYPAIPVATGTTNNTLKNSAVYTCNTEPDFRNALLDTPGANISKVIILNNDITLDSASVYSISIQGGTITVIGKENVTLSGPAGTTSITLTKLVDDVQIYFNIPYVNMAFADDTIVLNGVRLYFKTVEFNATTTINSGTGPYGVFYQRLASDTLPLGTLKPSKTNWDKTLPVDYALIDSTNDLDRAMSAAVYKTYIITKPITFPSAPGVVSDANFYGHPITFPSTTLFDAPGPFTLKFYCDVIHNTGTFNGTGAHNIYFRNVYKTGATTVNTISVKYERIRNGGSFTNGTGTASSESWDNTISAASGDFVGPASSTDNAVIRFDGTTGKLGQNSGVLIDDSNNITGVGNLTATGNLTVDTNTLFVDSVNNAVSIGTLVADPSSIFQLDSTTKGVLLPRMTATERDALINPARGLIIQNTTANRLQVNQGTPPVPEWIDLNNVADSLQTSYNGGPLVQLTNTLGAVVLQPTAPMTDSSPLLQVKDLAGNIKTLITGDGTLQLGDTISIPNTSNSVIFATTGTTTTLTTGTFTRSAIIASENPKLNGTTSSIVNSGMIGTRNAEFNGVDECFIAASVGSKIEASTQSAILASTSSINSFLTSSCVNAFMVATLDAKMTTCVRSATIGGTLHDNTSMINSVIAGGTGSKALSDQLICGRYNANINNNYFEVGGGTSDVSRKTIFSVFGQFTDSGIGIDGGIKYKEQSTAPIATASGYISKWFNNSGKEKTYYNSQDITRNTVFGSESRMNESLGEVTITNATVLQNVYSTTTLTLPAGSYIFFWAYQLKSSVDNTDNMQVIWDIDSVNIPQTELLRGFKKDGYLPVGGMFRQLFGTTTSHTITLKAKDGGGQTLNIKGISIYYFRDI